MLAVAAFLVGCQSTPVSGPTTPQSPPVSQAELMLASKADMQQCISAFYADDWDLVLTTSQRMADLADRWQEHPAPAGKEAEYQENIAGLSEAVVALRKAASTKDDIETTLALRRFAAHLAALDTKK